MNRFEFRRGAIVSSPDAGAVGGPLAVDLPVERRPALAQYLSIFRRRKWVIIGAIAAALLVGLVATLLITPRYTASATIEIQRETRNFINVEGVEPKGDTVDLEFYQTQYGLLRAKSLADRVATALRLYDRQDFFEMFAAPQAEAWFENGRPRPNMSTRELRVREAGAILLENFTVSPERLSRLVEIQFTSPDPAFSRQVVDAWGNHFIQAAMERRFEATAHARRFLEERLAQLRQRIDQSERQLVNYAAQQGIINLPAVSLPGAEGAVAGERSLVAEDLVALNRELAQATADRLRAESRLRANSGGSATEALQNDAIASMRSRRAELAAEYARMMVQFEPEYPPARALQTQIQQLDRSIGREEARVQANLSGNFAASRQREAALRSRVDELKGGMLDLRRRSIQYNIFQRDVDTNRELYDALLQRYKEIGVAGAVGVNNIAVVDEAEIPQRPSSPRLLLNMILALLAGTAVGIGAAFALEQIDEAVADPTELEDALKVPLLGTIPKSTEGDPFEALHDLKSSLSEAYMSVQTSLSFATDHGVPRTIAITSTRPAEGKTTTSYAIARSLARTNRRTLLLDSDMRSPSMHGLLGLSNQQGLSNFLTGSDNVDSLIHRTDHDGLFVMTAGPQPPSAAELLASDRYGRLLEELATRFDHIVCDAPPVMGLADAPLIASRVEGLIFVIESHGTKKSMARLAIARLKAAEAQIIGAVLTKFDVKRAHYGYGYDYGYGYGSATTPAPSS